jgi:hypothetical protein
MNLLKHVKVTVISPAAVAAQTAIDSTVLDMQGFDGVMFIALTGDATSGTVLTLTPKGNTASSTSSPAPVALTAIAATYTATGAADADSMALICDVYRPQLRYIYANLTRTTQNCVIGGIIAIQYCAAKKPTAQDASVIASTFGVGT